MIRGTTPTITLELDADLSDWVVYVTMKGIGGTVEISGDRLEYGESDGGYTVTYGLTQRETLKLKPGKCEVQIRAVKDGTAVATDIAKLDVGRILKEGVING